MLQDQGRGKNLKMKEKNRRNFLSIAEFNPFFCIAIFSQYSESLIQDLDLLILGGYYGEGKWAGIFSSFLVGVAEDEKTSTKKFYSVVSVSTGLTMEKMKELDAKFKPFWIQECPGNVIGPKVRNSWNFFCGHFIFND